MKQFTQEEINILGKIKSPDGKTAMELILSGRLRADESAPTVQETTVQQSVTEPEKPHIYNGPVGAQQMISAQHMIPEGKTQVNNYGGEGFTYNEKTTPHPVVVEPVQQTIPQPQIVVGRGPNTGSSLLDMFVNGAYASFAVLFIAALANQERVGDLLSGKPYGVPIIIFMAIGAIRFLIRMATSDGDVIYAATGRKKVEIPVGSVMGQQSRNQIAGISNPANSGVGSSPKTGTHMVVNPTTVPNASGYNISNQTKSSNSGQKSALIVFIFISVTLFMFSIAALMDTGIRDGIISTWESIFNPAPTYVNQVQFNKFENGSVNDIIWLRDQINNTEKWAMYEGIVSGVDEDLLIVGELSSDDNSWFFAGHYNYQRIPNVLSPGQRVRVYISYIDGAYDADGKVLIDAYPAMVEVKGANGWETAFNLSMRK